MRVFRIIWRHAADRSTLPECPASKLKWFPEECRTRHVGFEQMSDFHRAVLGIENPIARDFVLLLLFTGMRRREAASLRWSSVDLKQKVIRLPRDVTKGKRALELPMSTVVHDLLIARRAAVASGPFVFPGQGEHGFFTSADHAFAEIEKASGIKVSAHDLRRSFASVAADTEGVSWLALKVMLNHSTKGDVTAGYVQISEAQLRQAIQRVADRMLALCNVEPVAAPNVAKLR